MRGTGGRCGDDSGVQGIYGSIFQRVTNTLKNAPSTPSFHDEKEYKKIKCGHILAIYKCDPNPHESFSSWVHCAEHHCLAAFSCRALRALPLSNSIGLSHSLWTGR